MQSVKSFKLFVLRKNVFFDKGTLLELDENIYEKGYSIQDTGNGEPGFIKPEDVCVCPSFAENIPPAKCTVKITSVNTFEHEKINECNIVSVFQSIHFQQIRIPLPDQYQKVNKLILNDRLKEYEQYNLDDVSTEKKEGKNILLIEISHLPPGFYEILLNLKEELSARICFIKFYPDYLKERFLMMGEKENTLFPERKIIIAQQEITEGNDQTALLNLALELVTEWGENYNKAIDERILQHYPHLTGNEISALTKSSREAESFIYSTCEDELTGKITENEIFPIVKIKYPWLNNNNISRLKNIGMFYARK